MLAAVKFVAAAYSGPIADLVQHASDLANRATSYPLPVKILFVANLVIVLASLFVYALLFPATKTPDDSPQSAEEDG